MTQGDTETNTATYEIHVDRPLRTMPHTYVLIINARNTDRPDLTNPRPVTAYTLNAASLAAALNHNYQHGSHQLVYVLGQVSREQAEAICARIADSGLIERAFAADVEPGTFPCARVVSTDAADDIEALTQTTNSDLPAGWARYRTHQDGTLVDERIWPAGDSGGLARWLSVGRFGAAVWPVGTPEAVVLAEPAEYLERLTALGEQSPVPRRPLVVAAWRAGLRNVAAIAAGVDAHRNTVYADLRSAGIDPATQR